MMSEERFEIKRGRFGSYFYDKKLEKDLDLNEVLNMLNEWGGLMNLGEALEGHQR